MGPKRNVPPVPTPKVAEAKGGRQTAAVVATTNPRSSATASSFGLQIGSVPFETEDEQLIYDALMRTYDKKNHPYTKLYKTLQSNDDKESYYEAMMSYFSTEMNTLNLCIDQFNNYAKYVKQESVHRALRALDIKPDEFADGFIHPLAKAFWAIQCYYLLIYRGYSRINYQEDEWNLMEDIVATNAKSELRSMKLYELSKDYETVALLTSYDNVKNKIASSSDKRTTLFNGIEIQAPNCYYFALRLKNLCDSVCLSLRGGDRSGVFTSASLYTDRRVSGSFLAMTLFSLTYKDFTFTFTPENVATLFQELNYDLLSIFNMAMIELYAFHHTYQHQQPIKPFSALFKAGPIQGGSRQSKAQDAKKGRLVKGGRKKRNDSDDNVDDNNAEGDADAPPKGINAPLATKPGIIKVSNLKLPKELPSMNLQSPGVVVSELSNKLSLGANISSPISQMKPTISSPLSMSAIKLVSANSLYNYLGVQDLEIDKQSAASLLIGIMRTCEDVCYEFKLKAPCKFTVEQTDESDEKSDETKHRKLYLNVEQIEDPAKKGSIVLMFIKLLFGEWDVACARENSAVLIKHFSNLPTGSYNISLEGEELEIEIPYELQNWFKNPKPVFASLIAEEIGNYDLDEEEGNDDEQEVEVELTMDPADNWRGHSKKRKRENDENEEDNMKRGRHKVGDDDPLVVMEGDHSDEFNSHNNAENLVVNLFSSAQNIRMIKIDIQKTMTNFVANALSHSSKDANKAILLIPDKMSYLCK